MERLTFEGKFCDIAKCSSTPGGSLCEDGACGWRRVWERLKAYEDTGLEPERVAELAQAEKAGRLVVSNFLPGDEIWAIERDEDGTAYDVSGYMFLAPVSGYVIVSAYINDYDSLEETMDYHACETAENYDTDLAVIPACDVYGTKQAAKEALRKETDDHA